jgi:hypothetical protein
MKRTRFLLLPTLAILLLLIGLLGLGSQRLGLVHASGTTVQVTNCHDSGPGSLRDTLASAASGSIITFSLSCDIQLNSTLIISKTLTLSGEGQQVILDGQHAVQVLLVPSGVTFTLKTLTIANGTTSDLAGGLVNNGGTVNITNSTVSGNSGAGIDNGGTMRITNSTVIGNSSYGIFNWGTLSVSSSTVTANSDEGIRNFGMVSVSNSTVTANSGIGIFNGDGLASISNSRVSGNGSDGIDNFTQIGDSRSSTHNFNGRMLLTNSTGCNASYVSTICISNTTVSGNGGEGIDNFNGTVRVSNSTVSGNGSIGIDNDSDILDTTLTISNSTVAANFYGISNSGAMHISNSTIVGNRRGGIAGRLSIRGSIVAHNSQSNCASFTPSPDNGDNLSSDSSCHFTASTSLQNTDPKLDPAGLANNGGPTQTIALQPDSPVLDRLPVANKCPATDERGVSRPQGPNCDSGAFEMTATDGLTVMMHVVNRFQLAKDLQTSLDQQLKAVLADLGARQTTQACQDLTSFSNSVQAQSGNGLTSAQATQLLQEAAVIHTRLGC